MVHLSRTITDTKNLKNIFRKGCRVFHHPAAFFFLWTALPMVFHVKHHSSALIYRTERLLNDTLSSVVANSTKTVLDVWPEGTRPAKAVLGNHIEAKPKVTEKGHHTTAEKYDSQAGPLVDSKTKEFNHLWQFNTSIIQKWLPL